MKDKKPVTPDPIKPISPTPPKDDLSKHWLRLGGLALVWVIVLYLVIHEHSVELALFSRLFAFILIAYLAYTSYLFFRSQNRTK